MEDADAKLHQLARSEKQCTKCEELAACRLRAVAGAGHPHASVMFVSLCPSSEDETEDLPAGSTVMRELTEFIPSLGNGSRDKAFCTTLLKCVPRSARGVRDPRPEEQENCFAFLSKEISITTPHYIVAVGEQTTRFLLKKLFHDLPYSPDDTLELRVFDSPGMRVVPIATPAELRARDAKTRKTYTERLHQLAALMGL